MYRDNSLMPKEAVRLAALGHLRMNGTSLYAALAAAVRHFTSRVVGPSLDLMGTSLEMLRLEGLITATGGTGNAAEPLDGNPLLSLTPSGIEAFETLMRATVRAPSTDEINKLVIALKLRFLHLLDSESQIEQVDSLIDLCEAELVRFSDLQHHYAGEAGYLGAWLEQDITHTRERLLWFRDLYARLLDHRAV